MIALSRAIDQAAIIKAAITTAERELQEAIDFATEAGLPAIAAKLTASLTHIEHGHARAGEAAALVAAHFGEQDASVFSGGDDKPSDPPKGP